jgi:hypothetical protein
MISLGEETGLSNSTKEEGRETAAEVERLFPPPSGKMLVLILVHYK